MPLSNASEIALFSSLHTLLAGLEFSHVQHDSDKGRNISPSQVAEVGSISGSSSNHTSHTHQSQNSRDISEPPIEAVYIESRVAAASDTVAAESEPSPALHDTTSGREAEALREAAVAVSQGDSTAHPFMAFSEVYRQGQLSLIKAALEECAKQLEVLHSQS